MAFCRANHEKQKITFCKSLGWIAFITCYLFIYILSDGSVFYVFLDKLGINSMGRNYYYKAVLGYSTFSPSFLGIGRNMIAELFQTDLSYLKVGGVHSDIIKMYVENGFVMFGLWLWYHLVFMFNIFDVFHLWISIEQKIYSSFVLHMFSYSGFNKNLSSIIWSLNY